MPLSDTQLKECETLRRLFTERSTMSQREFAARYKLGTPGNLWQYLHGRRALNLAVAVKIAAGLGVKVEDFSPRLAREQEALSAPNVVPVPGKQKRIPLLSYVQAGGLTDAGQVKDFFTAVEDGDYVTVDAEMPDGCFALKVRGRSMEPDFVEGDIIVVDPGRAPSPGDFVVANRTDCTDSLETTFKKYRPRGYDEYGREIFELVPLNEDFPTLRSDRGQIRILGVMVEHRRKYYRY